VPKFEVRQQRFVSSSVQLPRSLAELVDYFNLPAYTAHHALADALATAQLFLALRARLDLQSFRQVKAR